MQTQLKTLSDTQLDHLIASVPVTWHRAFITLLADTGLRISELAFLLQSDLWFEDEPCNQLEVRSAIAKNHTPRSIPMTVRAIDAICDLRAARWMHTDQSYTSWAFPAAKPSAHITTRTFQRICKYYGSKYLKKQLTPHMLRHTFATRLMRKTNIRIVQQLLGHKSLSSTQIYTHPNSQDLAEAIATISA